MDGLVVIRALLLASEDVTALVPPDRIQADVLPEGSDLPAIMLEHISSTPRNALRKGGTKHFRDRIQVTPNAADYDQMRAICDAVFAACADQRPKVDGLTSIAVTAASVGPDGFNPVNNARARPMDFTVNYNKTAEPTGAGLHVVVVDADGNPVSVPLEVQDADGNILELA